MIGARTIRISLRRYFVVRHVNTTQRITQTLKVGIENESLASYRKRINLWSRAYYLKNIEKQRKYKREWNQYDRRKRKLNPVQVASAIGAEQHERNATGV